MAIIKDELVSVVVPLYNERVGLVAFHKSLVEVLKGSIKYPYEIIYCDDGSTDGTADLVREWCKDDANIRLIQLSRNFGKENALTAGIAAAQGAAILTLDGDGQHPVEAIPEFIAKWQQGSRIVVGISTNGKGGGWTKRAGRRLFYQLFNILASQKLISGSTDFRLIDQSVQEAFLTLPESGRITRGLIDWLGFDPAYVQFSTNERDYGRATYSYRMLARLAANSFVSYSPTPLYVFGYLGIFITLTSGMLGLSVLLEQLLLGDPLRWRFTGTAMLSILVLFLVGLILISQGLLSLYISYIHNQSKQRPLYVVDYKNSIGVNNKHNV